jgi:predicted GIY-YIG superfamily endonuclease
VRDINVLPTWVYYLQNVEGDSIYVGATCALENRLSQHRATKPWWGEVDYIVAELYPNREQALTWEACSIRDWRPRYNREVPPQPVIPTWITDGSWRQLREVHLLPAAVA